VRYEVSEFAPDSTPGRDEHTRDLRAQTLLQRLLKKLSWDFSGGNRTKSHNIYWVNQDGAWKLSNPSACVIANDVAGFSCTV
jgi:hypothetical protein